MNDEAWIILVLLAGFIGAPTIFLWAYMRGLGR